MGEESESVFEDLELCDVSDNEPEKSHNFHPKTNILVKDVLFRLNQQFGKYFFQEKSDPGAWSDDGQSDSDDDYASDGDIEQNREARI